MRSSTFVFELTLHMTHTNIGSLRILPKDPRHVTGDGDDGDTTRLQKAIAMAAGINLRTSHHEAALRSMVSHKRWSRSVLWAGVGILLALTARTVWRLMAM